MEYDFQTILSSSDKCGVGICENSIEHYCQTHRKLICKSCLLRFHTDCKSVDQINIKTMILAINKQKFKLNEIIEYDTNFNFSSRFDNLNGELTFYKVEIDEIEGKINTIASNFNASKLAQIHENIMRLYKLFLNSDLYVKYLKDKEATKDLNIEFNRSQSKATDEVKQLEEEKTTPTETNLKRENKILKEEIAKLKSQINSSNSKNESGAQEIKEEQLKSNKNSFPFYLMLGYYSKSFVFNEEGILTIDMKKVRQYDLIKLFALNKAKLPNLKGLKINGIIPNCLYLKDFFAYCFPDKLKYFCLGSRYGNDINIKNFQKSLFPHLCKVEEEIFLWRCRFEDTETFNNFIKCSRNCKRIVSNRCTHRLAKPCDFNFKNKSEYLIECISFGSYYACDDTPGFSKDKASFENFAKGVKSCKDLCKSLKTIQIDKDQLNPNTVIDILKKDTNISQMFLEGRCDPLI